MAVAAGIYACADSMRFSRMTPESPNSSIPPPAICPLESRPCVSSAAAFHLASILDTSPKSRMVLEWLRLCAASDRRVPYHLLPTLIDASTKSPENLQYLCRVLGARGFWLVSQNPKWTDVEIFAWTGHFPDAPESLRIGNWPESRIEDGWHVGESQIRFGLLRALRKYAPEKALTLVKETWKRESVNNRGKIIGLLAADTTSGEESFFEDALDDKNTDVKLMASRILLLMANSAIKQRFESRGSAMIRLSKNLLGIVRLDVTEPDITDVSAVRDGLRDTTSQNQNAGPTSQFIERITACIRPSFWLTQLELRLTPAQFINGIKGSKWKDEILEGVRKASILFNDHCMSELLINELMSVALDKQRLSPFDENSGDNAITSCGQPGCCGNQPYS